MLASVANVNDDHGPEGSEQLTFMVSSLHVVQRKTGYLYKSLAVCLRI